MAPFSDRLIDIPSGTGQTTHLFFFIPGNPGCISYYEAFFVHLNEMFIPQTRGVGFSWVGTSLGNFDTIPDRDRPFSLQEQIAFVEQRLYEQTESIRSGESADVELKVVLAGHSVGAFIGMEVLRRWMESAAINTVSAVRCESSAKLHPKVRIVGFIGLWPTITHIVRSPNGRKLGRLLCFTHLALVASMIVSILKTIVPTSLLRLIVRKVTGFPDDAVRTTLSFVQHQYQVRQALHMARDEMKEITADRWQDDVWHAGPSGPRLAFVFGAKDEWVENKARKELFLARKAYDDRVGARLDIERDNIPHSFCINHSQVVAERTIRLIQDIIEDK